MTGDGTVNGAKVQLPDCTGTTAQKWAKRANGSLVNTESGRCLGAPGGLAGNGNRLQLWGCNGQDSPYWSIHTV
ncbi:ricin-type beta-trefoil lectin domain protein [Streptomyces sp. NPDC058251]|uniref:ricin-type beta-trefoil lectin domain protein n=1 Tax=unclassified Streptomyces TaxID=2593676 RepID=UPI0036557B52